MSVRKPAVAGRFYPEDPVVLQETVQQLLDQAKQHFPYPKALIVPHAALMYSGPIAASAYASLVYKKNTIKKIVMLGPAHTHYFKGIAFDPVEKFSTPLGTIDQDKELLTKIRDLPYVHALAQAHEKEHCLEVQWPFCQTLFSEFTVLPLIVGDTTEQEVAQVLESVWGNDETLIIISSDLSHYLPYELAQQTDARTCLCIDTLNHDTLHHTAACGYYPLRGFLSFARQKQMCGRLLDLRNSGDTAGDPDKVVGYAAYHFYQELHFADHCKDELLYLAQETIRLKVEEDKHIPLDYQHYNQLLQIRMPSFVTIKKNGILRGCMGNLYSQEHLAQNVINNAYRAGFADPRFPPLSSVEMPNISLSISILSPVAPIHFNDEQDLAAQLRIGLDGIILTSDHYQSTFLPSVWESIGSPHEFLKHLKLKMGLPGDYWSENMRAFRYTVESIQ